jgi:hypothetical protein
MFSVIVRCACHNFSFSIYSLLLNSFDVFFMYPPGSSPQDVNAVVGINVCVCPLYGADLRCH